jgi:hypothetical protein
VTQRVVQLVPDLHSVVGEGRPDVAALLDEGPVHAAVAPDPTAEVEPGVVRESLATAGHPGRRLGRRRPDARHRVALVAWPDRDLGLRVTDDDVRGLVACHAEAPGELPIQGPELGAELPKSPDLDLAVAHFFFIANCSRCTRRPW